MADSIDQIRELLAQAQSSDAIECEKVAEVLTRVMERFDDDKAASLLMEFAGNENPAVRQHVCQLLKEGGYAGTLPVLHRLAMDEEQSVRSAAFRTLGKLYPQEEVDFLLNGLNDPSSEVRQAVMETLVVISGPQVIAKFTADLYHEDIKRQCLAIMALGMIGGDDVVESLRKATNHPEITIRELAISFLSKVGREVNSERRR